MNGALADRKLVLLAYAWLARHCEDICVSSMWFGSLFAGAPVDCVLAEKVLSDFEANVGSVLQKAYPKWNMAGYVFTSAAFPSVADDQYFGAFADLQNSSQLTDGQAGREDFRGHMGARTQPPFPGLQHCALALPKSAVPYAPVVKVRTQATPVATSQATPGALQVTPGSVSTAQATPDASRTQLATPVAPHSAQAIPAATAVIPAAPPAPAAPLDAFQLHLSGKVYSGMDLRVEDEQKPPEEEAVRSRTKIDAPARFSGLASSTLDFIAWIRLVDLWWQLDTVPLHKRTDMAASRLTDSSAAYWSTHKAAALNHFSRPEFLKVDDHNMPYIPYTAFKHVMAVEYAGRAKLRSLKNTLSTLIRGPDTPIHEYNQRFRLLVADIATFGEARSVTPENQMDYYLKGNNLKIPAAVQGTKGQLEDWETVEQLMSRGELEEMELDAANGVLTALTTPPSKSKRRQSQQQQQQASEPPAGRPPQQQRRQQNNAFTGHKRRNQYSDRQEPAQRPRHHQQPPPGTQYRQPGGSRRPRDAPPRHTRFPPPPAGNPHRAPMCTYCGFGRHSPDSCAKRNRDLVNIQAGRPPSPNSRDRR
jgi:hypothetical protein